MISLTESEGAGKFIGQLRKSAISRLNKLVGMLSVGHTVGLESLSEGEIVVDCFSYSCLFETASVASKIRLRVKIWTCTVFDNDKNVEKTS
jgi:hypothetical protein